MTFGVDARFVDPRVQRRVVNVVDLLVRGHTMIQLDGIGASSAKGVTRVERFHKLQGVHVRLDVRMGLLELGPLAFPYFENVVPFPKKGGNFGLGLFEDVLHGTVTETQMLFMAYRTTLGEAVPETPVKFVHSVGLVMKTVHNERGPGDVILASIAHVLQVMTVGRMGMAGIGASHPVFGFQVFRGELTQGLLAKLVIAPGQPFEGHSELIDLITPSAHGFTGPAVGDHAAHAQISVASRGNGYVVKRVEPVLASNKRLKDRQPSFNRRTSDSQ